MNKYITTIALIILGMCSSQSVFADVKIKTKQTMSGQTYENTTYIKGKRQRSEQMSGMMISLTQCDLRRSVQINPNSKTYMVNEFGVDAQTAKATAVTDKNGVVQAGGKVTTTMTTKDTGERKQMFGFTARRLITTLETVPSADACTKTSSKMEFDGWYIDAAFVLDCDYGYSSHNYNSKNSGGCRDKYEMKTIGTAKRGYPVYEKTTLFGPDGKETYSILSEVVELSKATLESALFEIPADYREVSDSAELYASMSNPASGSQGSTGTASSSMKLPNAGSTSAGASNTSGDSAAIGPKKAGTIRIGIAGVKTGAVGEGITSADLAAAVQNTLIQYLKVPNLEVVTLDAKLPSAAESEARVKECDFIIAATVSHKKGGGGFGGMLGQTLGSAVGRVGIGHTGSTIGNIAGQVATQSIVSATSVSASIKSKDEVTVDLRLNKIDGGQAFAKVYKAKAKSSGEDIISQIIEQAAQAVVDTVGR